MAYDCHQQVKAHDLKAFSPQELLEMKLEEKDKVLKSGEDLVKLNGEIDKLNEEETHA